MLSSPSLAPKAGQPAAFSGTTGDTLALPGGAHLDPFAAENSYGSFRVVGGVSYEIPPGQTEIPPAEIQAAKAADWPWGNGPFGPTVENFPQDSAAFQQEEIQMAAAFGGLSDIWSEAGGFYTGYGFPTEADLSWGLSGAEIGAEDLSNWDFGLGDLGGGGVGDGGGDGG